MKKTRTIILIFIISSNLTAQDRYKQIGNQTKLIRKIIENEQWENIHQYAVKELGITEESILDITKTIEFQKTQTKEPLIDEFFLNICDSVYKDFPYRKSGHLTNDLFNLTAFNEAQIAHFYKSLYPRFASIINIDIKILMPQLLKYLNNDAATRLCIRPIEWDELPYYLSISDVAMEIVEVKTYCDFFDNASNSSKLFSNLAQSDKVKTIEKIKSWYNSTIELESSDKVEYFLENFCELGHSFIFTCHNLLFSGDTAKAIKMYQKYYNTLSMPCSKAWEIGEILLSLGDNKVIEDCMNTSINYRCIPESGNKCVKLLMNSKEAYYRDELFAEIISTEPHSTYRKFGSGYIWYIIFGELADYDTYKLPKTLVALMSIQNNFNSVSSYYTNKWKIKYPEKIENNFRICDLALLKYYETIDKIEIDDWNDIKERNKAINLIKKKYKE